MDPKRELLRHTVATVAYRGGKAIRDTTDAFASFRPADAARSPAQILAHIGDLYDWALSIAKGAQAWNDSPPLAWPQEMARFLSSLVQDCVGGDVSPDILRAAAYACNVMRAVVEASDVERRLQQLEENDRQATLAIREVRPWQ